MCFLLQLSSLPDLVPALTAAEQRAAASLKWRTHEKLLQKYACLPQVISSDQIYYRFLQRMFTIMMTNVSPMPLIWFFLELAHILELTKFSTFLKSTAGSVHALLPGGVLFPLLPHWVLLLNPAEERAAQGRVSARWLQAWPSAPGRGWQGSHCTVTSALMGTFRVSWPQLCSLRP